MITLSREEFALICDRLPQQMYIPTSDQEKTLILNAAIAQAKERNLDPSRTRNLVMSALVHACDRSFDECQRVLSNLNQPASIAD